MAIRLEVLHAEPWSLFELLLLLLPMLQLSISVCSSLCGVALEDQAREGVEHGTEVACCSTALKASCNALRSRAMLIFKILTLGIPRRLDLMQTRALVYRYLITYT